MSPIWKWQSLSKEAEYIVRKVELNKDEARLAQIFSECFGPTTQRQVQRWFRQANKASAGWFRSLVAEIEGEVASNVTVELKDLHLGEGVYIKTGGIAGVCTCSDFRRKGIVTNLFEQCLKYVENSGVSNSSLYTGIMLPAHRIYTRKGFINVEKWSAYVKILDLASYFRSWIRNLNRYVKSSKIAQETLLNWDRCIVFELRERTVCFRFKHGRFKTLPRPPRSVDIAVATTHETLARVMWGGEEMRKAIETQKMQVKKGTESDLHVLRKILTGIWDA